VRAALIGFRQSGKTTMFQVLTENPEALARRQEDAVGMARVRDPRLDKLDQLFHPKKTTPVAHEIVDPQSPFPRVSGREEAGDKDPYPALRAADLLVLVLRAFDDPSVPPHAGSVDPERDRAQIEEELVLSDLVLVDTRLERVEKLEKIGRKSENPLERPLLQELHQALEAGKPIRSLELSREEEKTLRGFGFLSHKPVLAVYNHGEGAAPVLPPAANGFAAVALPARAEWEVLGLPQEERSAFRAELGIEAGGGERVMRAAEELVGLLTFFTAGPPEVKAWQVPVGSSVVDAAGKIHSDLARGFIRAEVVPWERLLEAGTWSQAREKGFMRTEGREYRVQEGDSLLVLFKV
jgi:ribosome-binding ATPase YchF (GTP1/OBG family)